MRNFKHYNIFFINWFHFRFLSGETTFVIVFWFRLKIDARDIIMISFEAHKFTLYYFYNNDMQNLAHTR